MCSKSRLSSRVLLLLLLLGLEEKDYERKVGEVGETGA